MIPWRSSGQLLTPWPAEILEKAKRLSHPSLVLRPLRTRLGADPDGAYRGHDGLARYFSVIPELTEQLEFRPHAVWEVDDAVIIFGNFIAAGESLTVISAMAVYRLRDGLIVSVQVFEQPDLERAPITQNEW